MAPVALLTGIVTVLSIGGPWRAYIFSGIMFFSMPLILWTTPRTLRRANRQTIEKSL